MVDDRHGNRLKCRLGCECRDTGFVEVRNFGLFDKTDETIVIVCNGPLGDYINSKREPAKRSPTYDPETMILVGEVKQIPMFY